MKKILNFAMLSLFLAPLFWLAGCGQILVPTDSQVDNVMAPISWKGAYDDIEVLTASVQSLAVAVTPSMALPR